MLAVNARYGFVSSEQHYQHDGGSKQNASRYLARCVEHKLLRRVDTTPEPFFSSFFDARPRTFAITAKGLRALAAAGMSINVAPKKGSVLIAHELACTDFCFSMNAAVAAHGGVRLIDQPELMSTMPAATRNLLKPLRLKATVHPRDFPNLTSILKEPVDVAIEPDRVFALVLPDNTGWACALELDRGTEDLAAHRIQGRATFLRKLVGYTSCWREKRHITQWSDAFRAFRALVVSTSEARIQHMMRLQTTVGAPAGLFAYSTPERLNNIGALGPAWCNLKQSDLCLVEHRE